MITRRGFVESLLAATAASFVKANSALQSDDASAVYRNAFVLDCNTLASIGLFEAKDQDFIKAVSESGVNAVKSTLGAAGGSFEQAVADIAAADHLIETRSDLFLKIRAHGDLMLARQQHKLGVIYSFEAASPLEDKIERIEVFRRLGVLAMQLTYNRSTPLGTGCLDGDTGGLTDLGRKAIARMNEVGVGVDLSHSNTQTTAEGIAASKKPAIISHAGCRAVYRHPRNKEDREMKALADKGGVMGIYMLPFLTASPKQPMLADYMEHMNHAIQTCGEDHVGVGSDVPFQPLTSKDLDAVHKDIEQRKAAGISAPGEDRPPYIPDLNTPRKMETLTAAMLKHGYPSRTVEKVLGENFLRVFKEIW
jgi:membrane dipeptidase